MTEPWSTSTLRGQKWKTSKGDGKRETSEREGKSEHAVPQKARKKTVSRKEWSTLSNAPNKSKWSGLWDRITGFSNLETTGDTGKCQCHQWVSFKKEHEKRNGRQWIQQFQGILLQKGDKKWEGCSWQNKRINGRFVFVFFFKALLLLYNLVEMKIWYKTERRNVRAIEVFNHAVKKHVMQIILVG